MMATALAGSDWKDLVDGTSANHLDTAEKNNHVANFIKHAIVNYSTGDSK